MRIQLLYAIQSDATKAIEKKLETLIAEERLPIPIELFENETAEFPLLCRVRIVPMEGDPLTISIYDQLISKVSIEKILYESIRQVWIESTVSPLSPIKTSIAA